MGKNKIQAVDSEPQSGAMLLSRTKERACQTHGVVREQQGSGPTLGGSTIVLADWLHCSHGHVAIGGSRLARKSTLWRREDSKECRAVALSQLGRSDSEL